MSAFLGKGKKCDLVTLAMELGEEPDSNMVIRDLKDLITNSKAYDEPFVKDLFESIVNTRIEEEKQAQQMEAQKQQIEAQKQQIEAQRLQMQFELDKLKLEVESGRTNGHGGTVSLPNSVTQVELAKSMPKFDVKDCDIILYLALFERQAKRMKVEDKDLVSCLLPLMPTDIVELIARVPDENFEDYQYVKDILLKRCKMSAEGFRQKFVQHQKNPEKTWKDFAYEMTNYFQGWLDGLDIKNFEMLKELMITDQIKRRVPQEIREHFVDDWGKMTKPFQLVDKIDEYESARRMYKRQSNVLPKVFPSKYDKNDETRKAGGNLHSQPQCKKTYWKPRYETSKGNSKFTCFSCGMEGHGMKFCPKLTKPKIDQDTRRKANVNTTVLERKTDGKDTRAQEDAVVVAKVVSLRKKPAMEKLCELERVPLSVDGKPATALIDSGTEITVVRKDIVSHFSLENRPSIFIRGIFGPAEKCPLVNVPMGLILGGPGDIVHQDVLCAVAPSLIEDVLLPPEIRNTLGGGHHANHTDTSQEDLTNRNGDEDLIAAECKNDVNFISSGEEIQSVQSENKSASGEVLSKADQFRNEQETCEELNLARKRAKENTGGYFFLKGLLFHKDKILGESVNQLVLPKRRRNEVLKLAHTSVFGGHMGAKKTTERIRYSFYWDGLSKEVRSFCHSCKDCQLTRRVRQKDRAPITPVTRPDLPFQVVNVDIIGPIEPPSSKGHKYVLCMVDQHTRWAEAVPLTSLTAKATCEALLSIFMRTGIPNVIASDNGTNFNAELTQEFERKMGCSPRFSTPLYPQSNGLVERFNQTLKRMLHHVILEEPRNWHAKLPFILWAYREVPNSTTGVAPFQLLYGRKPEGPLSILKNTWTGQEEGLQLDTTPVTDYMEKLKSQLEDAAEKAKVIAGIQQEKMSHYYNLRSSRRLFKPGDKVIVLIPDSKNKLLAKWQGPGVIESQKNEHSFFVRMPDNSVKHVHQNKVREFVAGTNTVNIIFEGEEDFGDVESTPLKEKNDAFAEQVRTVETTHLNPVQEEQLKELLKRFEFLFTKSIQPVEVGEHSIELLPGSTRQKPHSYSIPMAYRAEVDRQVEELLDLNLIEHSNAEITYPVVCVAKKDASIRLCVDYRALNKVTKVPSYPMKDIQETIFTAGVAKWLTCLDLLKGYYQIRMKEGDKPDGLWPSNDGIIR